MLSWFRCCVSDGTVVLFVLLDARLWIPRQKPWVSSSYDRKKKQDENKKTAHSCLHVLCYWWGFIRQWRQGNFLEHTDMQQRSRKGLSIVMSITKHHLLKMGSRFLFLCLALFDDCRECCPLVCIAQKIAVYHQLQTGRLSTGEVTLVRNRAETPGSRSQFPVNYSLGGFG